MPSSDQIARLIESELTTIDDPARRAALAALLIAPQPLSLEWGYGALSERLECWLVGLYAEGKGRLIFCDRGFGPAYPWGLVASTDDLMGMDSQWHAGLEHVAIGAGILPAPEDYEVP